MSSAATASLTSCSASATVSPACLSERFGFRVALAIQLLAVPDLPERIPMTEEELWALTRDKLAAAEESPRPKRAVLSGLRPSPAWSTGRCCGKSVYLVKTVAGGAAAWAGKRSAAAASCSCPSCW